MLPSRFGSAKGPGCPECEIATIAFRCEGSIVFKCAQCHGLWLRSGKKLGLFRRALERFNYQEFEVFDIEPSGYVVASCSLCHQVLDRFQYGYNSGAHLYRCDRCHGLWMPLRELIQLMRAVKLGQDLREDIRAWVTEIRRSQILNHTVVNLVRQLRSLI